MIKYVVDKSGDSVRFTCDRCHQQADVEVASLVRRFAPQAQVIEQGRDHVIAWGWSSAPDRGELCRVCARKGRRHPEGEDDGE
jgi:hypothetical protein